MINTGCSRQGPAFAGPCGFTAPDRHIPAVRARVQRTPSFLASSARPILDRPGRSRRLAISYNSARVFGVVPPVRLRCATAAPCLPSAVLVLAGMCAIVFLLDADR